MKGSNKKIRVRFWGVRGSVPSHDRTNRRFGGHTPCVSFHYQNECIICDGGTGLPFLGRELLRNKENITFILSHFHWDHIFGIPFFKPIYQKNRKILMIGPGFGRKSFKQTFYGVMSPPYFPITPSVWKAKVTWKTEDLQERVVGKIRVKGREVRHRGKTYGYRFLFPPTTAGEKERRLFYVTDHELSKKDKAFEKWIAGADLLIHDSSYDRKSYPLKKGWGHPAYEDVVEAAVRAKVKRLVLFHHSPAASDQELEKRLQKCRRIIDRKKSSLQCRLAKEGAEISL